MAASNSGINLGACSFEEKEEEQERESVTVVAMGQSVTSAFGCYPQYGEVNLAGRKIFCLLLLAVHNYAHSSINR